MDERENKALNSGLCNAKSIYCNIEEKSAPDKIPSARDYVNSKALIFSDTDTYELMESYAILREKRAVEEKENIEHNYELLYKEVNDYVLLMKQRPGRLGAIIDPISNDLTEILNQFVNNGK